jgi:hypothetical protein
VHNQWQILLVSSNNPVHGRKLQEISADDDFNLVLAEKAL